MFHERYLRSSSPCADRPVTRQVAEELREEGLPFPHLHQVEDDTPGLVILCKIAHTSEKRRGTSTREGPRRQVSGLRESIRGS